MQNNISPIITSDIPEYLRGDSPIFVSFIDTYFKYAEQRTKAIGSIQNRVIDTDIDTTLDTYISEFYATYGEYLPETIALDKRNFIKLLSSIYDNKGTKRALELIFKALFNEEITVSYPSEQILKASDGIWEVEKFITVVTKYGTKPINNTTISFSNDYGDFVIDTTKIVDINSTTCRIYFNTYSTVKVVDDQLINIYDSTNQLIYVGKVIKSPSNLIVTIPGKSWQVGQVITINGDGLDTIARVSKIVGADEGIYSVEILEYGIHTENEIILVSPYKNRPPASNLQVEKTLISVSPNVYHYSITVNDYTDGIYETITGVSDSIDSSSYFLSDYVVRGYFGQLLIDKTYISVLPQVNNQNNDITIGEWLLSRATLIYKFDNLVSTKGKFLNEGGQLSNQFVRLEDNYFYQPFSYVIETKRDIREYKNILNITHPAGTKRFSLLEKSSLFEFDIIGSRTISLDTTYFFDLINSNDSKYFTLNKTFAEIQYTNDTKNFILNKYMNDTVNIVSLDNAIRVTTGYDTGTYFSEKYANHAHNITIG